MFKSLFATERRTGVMLAITALVWGGNYVASKVFVGESPPITAAFVRFAIATLLILAVYAFEPGARLPKRAECRSLLAVGVIFFMYNIFFYTGLKLTTSSNASLLAAASPAMTALITARGSNERVTRSQVAGIALSFLGVALVVFKDSTGWASFRFNAGDIFIVLASLTWSFYSIWGSRAMKTLSPVATTAFGWLIATVLLFPAALLERHTHSWWLFSAKAWWSLAYVVIFSSVLSFLWWYQGIKVIGANRAAIFVNLIPVTGLILAVTLLKDRVSLQQILGAVLILGGVYFVVFGEGLVRRLREAREARQARQAS
jgi:drug/metabolite transporter (DMT)-like permease